MATRLILLGTGTPSYRPGVAQQSAAVVAGDSSYLIDCGDGMMLRAVEAAARGVGALAHERLTRLFLTHLHPDHTAGLPGLIIGPWVKGREEPLEIYGPTGTRELVDGLLTAYERGIAEHRDGLAPITPPLRVEVHEIAAGEIYRDDRVTVEAFRADHGSLEAYGLRFTTDDRVIVHSGDTRPTRALIEYARGCDILLHEVYSERAVRTQSAAWQRYHAAVHTSTSELAAIAAETRPGLLVVNHALLWGDVTPDELLDEIRARYDGAVRFGRDLAVFE